MLFPRFQIPLYAFIPFVKLFIQGENQYFQRIMGKPVYLPQFLLWKVGWPLRWKPISSFINVTHISSRNVSFIERMTMWKFLVIEQTDGWGLIFSIHLKSQLVWKWIIQESISLRNIIRNFCLNKHEKKSMSSVVSLAFISSYIESC